MEVAFEDPKVEPLELDCKLSNKKVFKNAIHSFIARAGCKTTGNDKLRLIKKK